MSKSEKKANPVQEKINLFLTIAVIVLLVIVPPILCGLFYLSQVPDVTFGSEDGLTYARFWMYRERRPMGVGYQSQQVVEEYTDTRVCVETRLRFLLWSSSRLAKPATSSRTMILVNDQWQPDGEACR